MPGVSRCPRCGRIVADLSSTIQGAVTRRPESSFLRSIYDPLLADAQREIELALKVAVAIEHDLPQAVIAERLGVTPGEVKEARLRLKRVRERLERDG
jgi:hypothetical protein